MELPLRDNVGDVAKRIPNSACCSKRDVYVTCEERERERVIRRSDELRSCGVCDGSTVQVVSKDAPQRKTQGREEPHTHRETGCEHEETGSEVREEEDCLRKGKTRRLTRS